MPFLLHILAHAMMGTNPGKGWGMGDDGWGMKMVRVRSLKNGGMKW
jgi:hypothetical protein